MKGDSVTVTYGDGKNVLKFTVEATKAGGKVHINHGEEWIEVVEVTISGRDITRLGVPVDCIMSIVERNGIPGKQGAAKP